VPFELLLPLGVVAFYLFDSSQMLYANELIFTLSNGRWDFSAGTGLILFGRHLYLPNPLTPQLAGFRVSWSDAPRERDMTGAAAVRELEQQLWLQKDLARGLLVTLLLALPLMLAWRGAGLELLVVFALGYTLSIIIMIDVIRRRRALHLSRRKLWSLSFDAIACPPFAINMVRKLSALHALPDDAIVFARSEFPPEVFKKLLLRIVERLDQEIAIKDVASADGERLRAFRQELQSLSSR
jgi:hypothetical protein